VKNLKIDDEDNINDETRDSDEFLEVIDGDANLYGGSTQSRGSGINNDDTSTTTQLVVDEDETNSSGDGNLIDEDIFVTPSPSTVQMITQVQRLSQLVQNVPKNNNVDTYISEISADDLNSFLDTQKIQTKSALYQNIDFHSNDKTPMPKNGKIQPEIMSQILDRQNELNKLTTIPMDSQTSTTASPKIQPHYYINKEPITEIKLKTIGLEGINGAGSHQIVVNRPEGSVLFNVPAPIIEQKKQNPDHNHHPQSPFLSQDILNVILQLSKEMVSQNHREKEHSSVQQQQPIYYAVPIPFLTPQNSVQNYYGHYQNQTAYPIPITTTTISPISPPPLIVKRQKPKNKIKNKIDNSQNYLIQQQQQQQKQQSSLNYNYGAYESIENDPLNYYQNYPQYSQYSQQQKYPSYNSMSAFYQYPTSSVAAAPVAFNQDNKYNRFSNLNGMFYENRPLVSDSSAPLYLERPQQQQQQLGPFRKESFSSSPYISSNGDSGLIRNSDNGNDYYPLNDEIDAFNENSYENDKEGNEDDNDDEEDDSEKGPTAGLVCSVVLARQANKTDCFRYYVCNSKTKEVLSYTCPAFTAFNDQTKFCDSNSYKDCKKMQDKESGSLKNKKMYAQAKIALQQAKRESQKIERIANLVKKQSQQLIYHQNKNQYLAPAASTQQHRQNIPQRKVYISTYDEKYQPVANDNDDESISPELFVTQRPIQSFKRQKLGKPSAPAVTTLKRKSNKKRKRKVKCTAGITANIPDSDDEFSYWHCFKSTNGKMKRIHKKCAAGLRFCEATRFCSSACH
jgi:hypothetical protein